MQNRNGLESLSVKPRMNRFYFSNCKSFIVIISWENRINTRSDHRTFKAEKQKNKLHTRREERNKKAEKDCSDKEGRN